MTRPIDAGWLADRHRADLRAREHSRALVQTLAEHLSSVWGSRGTPVAVVDVGAGTGANQSWLGPALARALDVARTDAACTAPEDAPSGETEDVNSARWQQDWHLVDHDAELLSAVQSEPQPWLMDSTRHVGSVGDVEDVVKTLREPRVVSCSALLDLLTPSQIETLVRATVENAQAALWSLSVTGSVTLTPASADDALVMGLFDADQQRRDDPSIDSEALTGPTGWTRAVQSFSQWGWRVETAATPWHLGPQDAALTVRLLTERAEAARAVDHDPGVQHRLDQWLTRRLLEIDRGALEISVDHADILALPPKATSVQMSSPS